MFKAAFAPVVDADTRLLILGSLPGDASLKAGQYYGHPQNGFWRLLGPVVGRDLAGLPYDDRLAGVIERLNVYPENMQKNLDRLGGLVFSQRVMLALTQAGMSREDAYAAVQENAMRVWRGEGRFLDFLKADERVTLPDADLEALFDLRYHTKHVDTVFARVFGD